MQSLFTFTFSSSFNLNIFTTHCTDFQKFSSISSFSESFSLPQKQSPNSFVWHSRPVTSLWALSPSVPSVLWHVLARWRPCKPSFLDSLGSWLLAASANEILMKNRQVGVEAERLPCSPSYQYPCSSSSRLWKSVFSGTVTHRAKPPLQPQHQPSEPTPRPWHPRRAPSRCFQHCAWPRLGSPVGPAPGRGLLLREPAEVARPHSSGLWWHHLVSLFLQF